MSELESKLKIYYLTAIFSMIFAVTGFSYNAWRLEVSEDNNNIRTAAFEVLTELAELQQLVYSAHYDQDKVAGNPRTGWVKIGLIVDLSVLIDSRVKDRSIQLKAMWTENWSEMQSNRQATDALVDAIDEVRMEITHSLKNLN